MYRPRQTSIAVKLWILATALFGPVTNAEAGKPNKAPWQDEAWSAHQVVAPKPVSPAKALSHVARLASAQACNKSPWSTDVRIELTESGRFAGLMGTDLAWKPGPALPTAATVGVWTASGLIAHAQGLGLDSSIDSLVAESVTNAAEKASSGWTIRLSRWHAGAPVLGDSATVRVDKQGRVRWLHSRFSEIQGIAQGQQSICFSSADGAPTGWFVPPDGTGLASMASAHEIDGSVRYLSLQDGTLLHEQRVVSSSAFDVVVTSRHMGATPDDHECVEPNVQECADTGRKAWRIGTNGQPLCCAQSPTCNPTEAANCTDPGYPGVVKDAVTAAAQMRSTLLDYGFTDYDQPQGGAAPAELVVAPYGIEGGTEPCPAVIQPGNACAAPGLACKGKVANDYCAIAFRPRISFTGSAVQCGQALAAAKGVVLMSDEAQQAPDVMAHEFGHLWLSGYGLPPMDSAHLFGQPMSLHESVSDGLGLVVDSTDWLVGEDTRCLNYRSACAPSCKTDSEIATYTSDPGCVEGPDPAGVGPPGCKVGQPRLWQDYELKPVGALGLGPHHNTGIANFVWFLIGTTSEHLIGGGPGPLGQGIVGQGREVLATILRRWVDQWSSGSTPTFDGLREGLLQIGGLYGEPVLTTIRQAVDAVGLWRTDARSSLFGVGRVASFTHGDGAGGSLVYAVNWDGIRRFEASRCEAGTAACLMDVAMRIEDPTWVDADYPLSPPVAVDVAPDETWLLYVGNGGFLVRQRVLQGAFQAPELTTVVPAGTLREGLAVGAVFNPAWGSGWDGVVLAYTCEAPACTCGGLVQANGRRLCVQAGNGSWFASPAALHPQENACAGLLQPINPPQSLPDVVGTFHEPALSLLNGQPILTWVDRSVTDFTMRVHYSVAHDVAGLWQWSTAKHWTTKGEAQVRDVPAKTDRPISAAVLPGADGWSSLPEDNHDRLYIMYSYVINPDPACNAGSRMFAYASARLSADGQDLADFSMGVGQNASSTSQLTPADIWSVSYLRDHGAAGGFLRASGRTFAWVRQPPIGTEPDQPDYALGPVDSYGPLLIKSTGWR